MDPLRLVDRERLLTAVKAELAASGAAALVAMAPENVYYASGAYIDSQKDIRERANFVVFFPQRDPLLVVCEVEAAGARDQTWLGDVRTYREFAQHPAAVLAEVILAEAGSGSVAVEHEYLPSGWAPVLRAGLGGRELISCDRFWDRLRMVKSPGEIEFLARIHRETERAILGAFAAARAGDTARSVAARMMELLAERGADSIPFLAWGLGREGSLLIHGRPDDTPLAQGDIVRVDYGGIFGGYWSDTARMAVVGRPSREQEEMWAALIDIQRRIIASMRPGASVAEVYAAGERAYARHGLPFAMHHVGHSIGLENHEYPLLCPQHDEGLQVGMAFEVEPFILHPELGGFHVEDLVAITGDGPMVLTGAFSTASMFVIG